MAAGLLSVVPVRTLRDEEAVASTVVQGGPALPLLLSEKIPAATRVPDTWAHSCPATQGLGVLGPPWLPRPHVMVRDKSRRGVDTAGLGLSGPWTCPDRGLGRLTSWGPGLLAGWVVYVLDSGTVPALQGLGGAGGMVILLPGHQTGTGFPSG